MKAIRAHRDGEQGALRYEEVPEPQVGPDQVLLEIEAIGVNFSDLYPARAVTAAGGPLLVGNEAAGTVDKVGAAVSDFKPGDRVAVAPMIGAYAEYMVAPADRLIPIPDDVTFRQAASAIGQGMTAQYLACSTYPLGPGDICLVHAAAGGVGLLLTQIARKRGARVLGTVSTPEKAAYAREAGAEPIIYTEEDFADAVKRMTEGRGVDVVYDSVGRTTFEKGLECLKPRGMMVLYGNSSGPVEPVDTGLLVRGGSLYLTRASMATYVAERGELLARARDVFDWLIAGSLNVHVHAEMPLSDAGKALELISNRATIGKLLLIP